MAEPGWVAEVEKIFTARGVPRKVWVPIMLAESAGNPGALLDTRNKKDLPAGTQAEYSVGLFGINLKGLGWTDAQIAAQGDSLKDPVTNATYAVPAIAAAWNAIKNSVSRESNTWAAEVAVRSGHPGGGAGNPCTSGWCNEVKNRINAIATQWSQATIKYWANNGAPSQVVASDWSPVLTSWWLRNEPGGVDPNALVPVPTGGNNAGTRPGSTPPNYPSGAGAATTGMSDADLLAAIVNGAPTQDQLAEAWARGITGSKAQIDAWRAALAAGIAWTVGGAAGAGAVAGGGSSSTGGGAGPSLTAGGLVSEALAAAGGTARAWLKTDSAVNVAFFLFGSALVVLVVWSLLWEGLSSASWVAVEAATGVSKSEGARGLAKKGIANAARGVKSDLVKG